MTREIKNVALAGSTGSLGSVILTALVAQNRFNITLLVRKSRHVVSSNVTVKVVDFDSVSSLTDSLKGQDAFIDATSNPDPTFSMRLIDAAVAANVYRLIPGEFSADPENIKTRSLPVFQGKDAVYKYYQQLGAEGKITWTAISNCAFMDWGLRMSFLNIDLVGRKINYMNDGNVAFPLTLLSHVGTAVSNALVREDETKNRVCYIHSIQKSQREVGELAKAALGGEWETKQSDMESVLEDAMKEVQAGNFSMQVIGDLIRYSISTPGYVAVRENDDSVLLGLKELEDEEVQKVIQNIAAEMNAAKK